MNESVGYEISRQQRDAVHYGQSAAGGFVVLRRTLPPGLDAATARQRAAEFVARTEILRTTLRFTAGMSLPLQTVHSSLDFGRHGPGTLDAERGPVLSLECIGDEIVYSALPVVADPATLGLLADAVEAGEVTGDPIQYAEYAAWQADEREQVDEAAAELARHRIRGDDDPTALPPPAAPPVLDEATLHLTGERTADQWLAAWVLTVVRLAGQPDVTLGVEVDPRTDPELDGAAGPYARLLAMRFTLAAGARSSELVEQVGRIRSLAGSWFESAAEPEECPISFAVGPRGSRSARGRFQLELRVADDLTAAEVVLGPDGSETLARRAATALRRVLAAPADAATDDVDVLSPDDIQALLGDAPATPASLPLLDLIARAASAHPDRIAVTDGTFSMTYRELIHRVDALTARLIEAGADRRGPVAIDLPRRPEMIVAMLAAVRSTAGYLPLDQDQPPNRTTRQMELAGTTVLISERDAEAGPPGVVVVAPSATGPEGITLPVLNDSDRAYVIFTSGSTGVPKGVAISVGALSNYCAAIGELAAQPSAADRPRSWALMTSPTTDLGNTVIFPALASGGTLHMVPIAATHEPRELGRYQLTQPLDIMKITPSHLGALLADDTADVLPRELLFVGGESLPWSLAAEVRSRARCRIVHHYGPTETTVGVLTFDVPDAGPERSGSVPIGSPLPGNEVLLIDSRRVLVPPGAVGQVAVGGAQLADGYLGDDVASAEKFVAHPYRPGRRLYLTGDLGRRDPLGEILFLGRRDGQVKVRGFRVECGEVEAALVTYPGVRRAAVVLRHDTTTPQLVGYAVCDVNPRPAEADLTAHVASTLPQHMVPARILVLDSLPLRANGKLDVERLPAPQADVGTAAPETASERDVVRIFADVLGLDDVGVDDDFFELGGHSLLATKIIVAVRQATGADLPVYSLFEAPTPRGIAALVDRSAPGLDDVGVDDTELAQMIADLDALSDDEVAALLAAQDGDGSPGRDRP